MENLSLIDVSSEDDLLISSISSSPVLRSSENHDEYNCIVLESANAHEGENTVKMSKLWEQAPELSESPERKRPKSGKVNLRKSLAWDSAFFTNEGVLNTEELAIVNSTFRKTETCLLPGIQEELCRSTESTSTLDSESYTLENLEVDLFENIRASIQKTVCKNDNTACEKPDSSQLSARKKVEISPQTKMKPPLALKRDGVHKRVECASKDTVINAKEGAKGIGNSKLLLKPPRTVAKPTQPTLSSNKDSSGSIQNKINIRRTSSGNGANSHGVITFSKTSGDSCNLPTRSLKPNPSTRLGTVVFSTSSHSSSSSPSSSSSQLAGKSPVEPTRKRSILRNSDRSIPGSTNKTPVSASKSTKLGSSNTTRLLTHSSSIFKFSSSRVSPSSSVDSFVSEASSSSSTSIKLSNSVESFASSTSSSLSFAVPTDINASQPTDMKIFLTDQPCIKRSISRNLLPSQQQNTVKASLSTRGSDLSSRDQIRSSINSNSGAKSFKPSGLRMPSPKIGYFDAEKTLVSNSHKFPQMGVRNSLLKSTAGISSSTGANKAKPSKIPTIKAAVYIIDSSKKQSVPPSPTMRTVSPLSMHQQPKPAHLHKDSSPVTGEDSCSMVFKGAVKMAEEVQMQSMTTVVAESGLNSENGTRNDYHSVSVQSQKENLLPAFETNGVIQLSPSKVSVVEIMDKQVASLSLSETSGFVYGD